MAAPVPKVEYNSCYRIQVESSYGAGGGSADWPIGGNGGGATGWRDWAVSQGQAPINAVENVIFPTYKGCERAINYQPPVPGRYEVSGSLESAVFLEQTHPILYGILGGQSLVETAGSAALASTLFASVSSLDTQPDGTEVLKFVVSSSTAASSAQINIVQNSATQETIEIGTSGSSVDGTYYSRGAYDGSTNAITFTVSGSVTGGSVVISGVNYVTGTFTLADTIPSFQIQEDGLARSATSMHFPGVIFQSVDFAFDATAADGLVTMTPSFQSQFPSAQTAVSFANEARDYQHPLGGWTASFLKDGVAYERVQSATLTINGGNSLFNVASGSQQPSGKLAGGAEATLAMRVIVEDTTEWNAYVGQTVQDYHFVLTSPNNVVDSTKFSMLFEMTKAYTESYVPAVGDNGMLVADITYRTILDATDGIIKATLVDRMPV